MFGKLFGKGKASAPGVGDPDLAAVRARFPALVLTPPKADVDSALEAWDWIGLPKSRPLLVSAFGDMFFQGRDGIVMLDTLDGVLRPVAADTAEFLRRLQDDEARDDLLSEFWVQEAGRRGLLLEPGECFDWAVPPALGGPITPEAVTKTLFVVKVDLAGQLHRQIQSLPPGTEINRVELN